MGNVDRAKLNLLVPNLAIGQTADPEKREAVFLEIYSELDIRPDQTEVLTKTNVAAFTPSSPYHPSTVKYVDDAVAAVVAGATPNNSIAPAKLTAGFRNRMLMGVRYFG